MWKKTNNSFWLFLTVSQMSHLGPQNTHFTKNTEGEFWGPPITKIGIISVITISSVLDIWYDHWHKKLKEGRRKGTEGGKKGRKEGRKEGKGTGENRKRKLKKIEKKKENGINDWIIMQSNIISFSGFLTLTISLIQKPPLNYVSIFKACFTLFLTYILSPIGIIPISNNIR